MTDHRVFWAQTPLTKGKTHSNWYVQLAGAAEGKSPRWARLAALAADASTLTWVLLDGGQVVARGRGSPTAAPVHAYDCPTPEQAKALIAAWHVRATNGSTP